MDLIFYQVYCSMFVMMRSIFRLKNSYIILFILLLPSGARGQKIFDGSFMMSFNTEGVEKSFVPMLWNVDGKQTLIELQDEMRARGVSKRVLFSPADSTWTMTISFNRVKQGTRIHAAAMYRDTAVFKPRLRMTNSSRLINGLKCRKYIIESKDYIAEIWVTDQYIYNIAFIYKLLSHCGMMGEFVSQGDWFMSKEIKGMIMEIHSVRKSAGKVNQSYTITISQLNPGAPDHTLFNLDGFKISDIPEGQHCGPVETGK